MDLLTDRTPLFMVRGEPFQTYVIETSNDLQNWVPIETWFTLDGIIEFTFVPSTSEVGRFFRAHTP